MEHSDGTQATHWVVVHVPNVEVIGLTRDHNIVFIQVKRGTHAVDSFELPGGKVFNFMPSPAELQAQTVDEVQTETGFHPADNMQLVHHAEINSDWLERRFDYFAAWDLDPGEPHLESGEDITTVLISVNEVEQKLAAENFPAELRAPLTAALKFFREKHLI